MMSQDGSDPSRGQEHLVTRKSPYYNFAAVNQQRPEPHLYPPIQASIPPAVHPPYTIMSDDEVDHDLLDFMREALAGRNLSAVSALPKTHVLESAEYIVDHSIDIFLSRDNIVAAANKIYESMQRQSYSTQTWSSHDLHPKPENGEDTVDYIFTMDLLNFSFWSVEDDPEKKFAIEYKGKRYTGYWSLVAAMNRALDEGAPTPILSKCFPAT